MKRVMREGSLPGFRAVEVDDDGLTPEQQEIKKLWEAIERIDHHGVIFQRGGIYFFLGRESEERVMELEKQLAELGKEDE